MNRHGNTPLHYACFWGFKDAALELINVGANVSLCNRQNKTPLDVVKGRSNGTLGRELAEAAENTGQRITRIPFETAFEEISNRVRTIRPSKTDTSFLIETFSLTSPKPMRSFVLIGKVFEISPDRKMFRRFLNFPRLRVMSETKHVFSIYFFRPAIFSDLLYKTFNLFLLQSDRCYRLKGNID